MKNGRVNKLVGAALNVLGIKIIARASEEGTIQPVNKARGKDKAYKERMLGENVCVEGGAGRDL